MTCNKATDTGYLSQTFPHLTSPLLQPQPALWVSTKMEQLLDMTFLSSPLLPPQKGRVAKPEMCWNHYTTDLYFQPICVTIT